MFHEFYNDTYTRHFLLAVGETTESLHEYMKKFSDKEFEPLELIPENLGSVDVFHGKHVLFVICLKNGTVDAMNLSTIHHECIHAASEVCKYVGIKHDFDNEEPYTYLSDWIFRQVVGALYEHNAK